jgi:hypothetical protein
MSTRRIEHDEVFAAESGALVVGFALRASVAQQDAGEHTLHQQHELGGDGLLSSVPWAIATGSAGSSR